MHFLIYPLIGVVAGILSGLLGVGGGIIVIPALAWVFTHQGFSANSIMHLAAGTSITAMIFTASSSLIGHLRHGVAVWPVYKKLVSGIIIGTIIGATFSHLLHSNILEIIFGIFVLIVAIRMLLELKPKPSRKLPGFWGTASIGLIIGGKSGLLGIGGGAITIPFLNYCNVPVRNTVAISAATSFTIACIGGITYFITGLQATNLPEHSIGYIYWPALIGIALTAPLFAQIGAAWSHKVPTKTLKRILGGVLIIIAINMLA